MASTFGIILGGILVLLGVFLFLGGLGLSFLAFQFPLVISAILQDLGALGTIVLGILVAVFI